MVWVCEWLRLCVCESGGVGVWGYVWWVVLGGEWWGWCVSGVRGCGRGVSRVSGKVAMVRGV